jgi:hypothetical protein
MTLAADLRDLARPATADVIFGHHDGPLPAVTWGADLSCDQLMRTAAVAARDAVLAGDLETSAPGITAMFTTRPGARYWGG